MKSNLQVSANHWKWACDQSVRKTREDEVVDEFWRESMWQVFRGLRCIDMIFWRTRGTCFTASPHPPYSSHFNFQHIFSMCNVVGGTWCDFYNRARCFAFDSYIDYVLNVDMTSRAIVLLQSEGTSQVSLLFIVCCSYCSRFKSWIVKILHIILSGFWCWNIQFDSSLCNQSPPPLYLRHLLQIWFLKRREFIPIYYRLWMKCAFSYFLELLRHGFWTFWN